MSKPNNAAARTRGGCPICRSRRARCIQEEDGEFVLIQRRHCKDCGAVYTPTVPKLLALPTFLLAGLALAMGVWGTWFDSGFLGSITDLFSMGALSISIFLLGVGIHLLRHREPMIHERPPRSVDQPWDKKASTDS